MPKAALKAALSRGLRRKCPHCGKGRLFSGYLKQVEHCAECGEALGAIKAEDGPAWLTILVVGHLLAPMLLIIIPNTLWPDWWKVVLLPLLALLLSMGIMPHAKGVFIAVLWRMQFNRD